MGDKKECESPEGKDVKPSRQVVIYDPREEPPALFIRNWGWRKCAAFFKTSWYTYILAFIVFILIVENQ